MAFFANLNVENMKEDVLISVVMPSFNQGKYIDRAISSFIAQDYKHKELIVIDAASTDGAVDIIKKYADNIAYWVSEKDNGQSHAINKGFAKANGRVLTWLNSDDVLMPRALAKVAAAWNSMSNTENFWIAGGVVWLDADDRIIQLRQARTFSKPLVARGLQGVFGPSSFMGRELLERFGALDESFHYMMDTELWIKLSRNEVRYTTVPGYVWGLRLHAEAKMSGHNFSGSAMSSHDHPVWVKRENERARLLDRFPNTRLMFWKFVSNFRSLFSPKTIKDRILSFRYKGKYLNSFDV